MEPVRTLHHTAIGVIYLGLIGQFHYQVLEKVEDSCPTPVTSSTSDNHQPTSNTSSEDHHPAPNGDSGSKDHSSGM